MIAFCKCCNDKFNRATRSNKYCLKCRYLSIRGRSRGQTSVSTYLQAVIRNDKLDGFVSASKPTELRAPKGWKLYGEAFKVLQD